MVSSKEPVMEEISGFPVTAPGSILCIVVGYDMYRYPTMGIYIVQGLGLEPVSRSNPTSNP